MTSRVPFYFLIALLLIIGAALSIMRHQDYGVPWTPGESRQVWDIEARIEFVASGRPVKVSLAVPHTQSGFTLIDESASSPGYGLSYVNTDTGRRAEWSIREAKGGQTIYYKTQFLVDANAAVLTIPPNKYDLIDPIFTAPQQAAVTAITEQASARSADGITFTRELIKQLNDLDNQNTSLLLNDFSKVEAISKLLTVSNIYSKTVGVLELEDGRRRQSIIPMIEVWDGERWQLFNPERTEQRVQRNVLIWDESNVSLLDVIGGKHSRVFYSMISQDITPTTATKKKAVADNLLNLNFNSAGADQIWNGDIIALLCELVP